MNRLVRLVIAGCGLILLLGWLTEQLQRLDTRAGEGGSVAMPIGLLLCMGVLGIGVLARLFGAGQADPERRRREARLRTQVRRPVEIDRRDGEFHHDAGGEDGQDGEEDE